MALFISSLFCFIDLFVHSSTIIKTFKNYYCFTSLAICFSSSKLSWFFLIFAYPYKSKISLSCSMIKTVKNLIGIASKYPINMGKINSLQPTTTYRYLNFMFSTVEQKNTCHNNFLSCFLSLTLSFLIKFRKCLSFFDLM